MSAGNDLWMLDELVDGQDWSTRRVVCFEESVNFRRGVLCHPFAHMSEKLVHPLMDQVGRPHCRVVAEPDDVNNGPAGCGALRYRSCTSCRLLSSNRFAIGAVGFRFPTRVKATPF